MLQRRLHPQDPDPELESLVTLAHNRDLVAIRATLEALEAKQMGGWRGGHWKKAKWVCAAIKTLWMEEKAYEEVVEAHRRFFFCGANALEMLRRHAPEIANQRLIALLERLEFPEEHPSRMHQDGLVRQLVSRPDPELTDLLHHWLLEAERQFITGPRERWEQHRVSSASPADHLQTDEFVLARVVLLLAERVKVDCRVAAMMCALAEAPPWGVNRYITMQLLFALAKFPHPDYAPLLTSLVERAGPQAALRGDLLLALAAFDPGKALGESCADLNAATGEALRLIRVEQFAAILGSPGEPGRELVARAVASVDVAGWSVIGRGAWSAILRRHGVAGHTDIPVRFVFHLVNLFWILRGPLGMSLVIPVLIGGFIWTNLMDLTVGHLFSPWGWYEFWLLMLCVATVGGVSQYQPDRNAPAWWTILKTTLYWGTLGTFLTGSLLLHQHAQTLPQPEEEPEQKIVAPSASQIPTPPPMRQGVLT